MAESALFALVRRLKATCLPALVTAHRGASLEAPENTLPAFERALAHGADLVEFDVHASADGELFVIHDAKVNRTTDGTGEVSRLPAAAIRELDAGRWFRDSFAGTPVPTLDETLDLLRTRAVPVVELKAKRKTSRDAGARVAQCLARHGLSEHAVVICREVERLREVRDASPATPLSFLAYTKRGARAASRLEGVAGLDLYWRALSSRLLLELRQRPGFFFTPWTVNRARDQERLLALGLETLITDDPAAFRALILRFDFRATAATRAEAETRGDDDDLEPGAEPGASPDAVAEELGTKSEVDFEG